MLVTLGLNEVAACLLALVTTTEVYMNLPIVELDDAEKVAYDDIEVTPVGVDVPLFVSVTGGDGYDPVAAVMSARVVDTEGAAASWVVAAAGATSGAARSEGKDESEGAAVREMVMVGWPALSTSTATVTMSSTVTVVTASCRRRSRGRPSLTLFFLGCRIPLPIANKASEMGSYQSVSRFSSHDESAARFESCRRLARRPILRATM